MHYSQPSSYHPTTFFLFTKLFSCFLCVLVILLLGRGWSCIGFSLRSFSGIWLSSFYLQMAMYVIGDFSVQLPPSTILHLFSSPFHPFPVLFHYPLFASREVIASSRSHHRPRSLLTQHMTILAILLSPSRILDYPETLLPTVLVYHYLS